MAFLGRALLLPSRTKHSDFEMTYRLPQYQISEFTSNKLVKETSY